MEMDEIYVTFIELTFPTCDCTLGWAENKFCPNVLPGNALRNTILLKQY